MIYVYIYIHTCHYIIVYCDVRILGKRIAVVRFPGQHSPSHWRWAVEGWPHVTCPKPGVHRARNRCPEPEIYSESTVIQLRLGRSAFVPMNVPLCAFMLMANGTPQVLAAQWPGTKMDPEKKPREDVDVLRNESSRAVFGHGKPQKIDKGIDTMANCFFLFGFYCGVASIYEHLQQIVDGFIIFIGNIWYGDSRCNF